MKTLTRKFHSVDQKGQREEPAAHPVDVPKGSREFKISDNEKKRINAIAQANIRLVWEESFGVTPTFD